MSRARGDEKHQHRDIRAAGTHLQSIRSSGAAPDTGQIGTGRTQCFGFAGSAGYLEDQHVATHGCVEIGGGFIDPTRR